MFTSPIIDGSTIATEIPSPNALRRRMWRFDKWHDYRATWVYVVKYYWCMVLCWIRHQGRGSLDERQTSAPLVNF